MKTLDVIIPTFNNPQYLGPCVESFLRSRPGWPLRLIIANNGHPQSMDPFREIPGIEVVDCPKNLGWEGGLKAGLERSSSEFVVFSNDDIFIPRSSAYWARNLLAPMKSPRVGAVGPSSNIVMGPQNIFAGVSAYTCFVPFLIGFFVLMRREALDRVGGIDDTLPGGDDLDLSIRLRQAGYSLVARLDTFIFHHGFITGVRVHGGAEKTGGWNSTDMQERTDNALIVKHGFRVWNGLYSGGTDEGRQLHDTEGASVATWAPEGRVLELGCGGRKTVPHAVGVDRFPEGMTTSHAQTSVAAIVADVFGPMPVFEDNSADGIIARHILEHAIDPVLVLREWLRILKPGGRLIVATPNQDIEPGIPMDTEHMHSWNPDSLRSLAELCGYRQVAYTPDSGNNISFISVFEKASMA